MTRINPITDQPEPQFSNRDRLTRYLKSALICTPDFIIVVFTTICFLNLTGIIDPKRHHALFQIEILSQFCKEGAIFDQNTTLGLLPTVIQVVISIIHNEKFKKVALKATEVENHRCQTHFNNSLIIKRFAFMFCDYFLYLFYIGCYELRIDLLR